jgi:hypothetical protein
MNLFDDLPFDIESEITAPHLADNVFLKELPDWSRAADSARAALARGETPENTLTVLQQSRLGVSLATALLTQRGPAAQDIALLYAITPAESHAKFFQNLVETLRRERRIDLFRPAILLLHRACTAQWRHGQSARQQVRDQLFPNGAPAILQETSDIPPHFRTIDTLDLIQSAWRDGSRAQARRTGGDSPSEEEQRANVPEMKTLGGHASRGAWNGALSWQLLGQSWCDFVQGLAERRGGPDTLNASLDLMAMSVDAVHTIPATRSWGAALVRAFMGTTLNNESLCRRKVFCDGLEALLQQANEAEAKSLLHAMVRTAAKTEQQVIASPNSISVAIVQRRVAKTVRTLIDMHPHISLEAWITEADAWLVMDDKPSLQDVRLATDEAYTVLTPQESSGDDWADVERSRKGNMKKERGRHAVNLPQIQELARVLNGVIHWAAQRDETVSPETSAWLRKLAKLNDPTAQVIFADGYEATPLLEVLADRSDLRHVAEATVVAETNRATGAPEARQPADDRVDDPGPHPTGRRQRSM